MSVAWCCVCRQRSNVPGYGRAGARSKMFAAAMLGRGPGHWMILIAVALAGPTVAAAMWGMALMGWTLVLCLTAKAVSGRRYQRLTARSLLRLSGVASLWCSRSRRRSDLQDGFSRPGRLLSGLLLRVYCSERFVRHVDAEDTHAHVGGLGDGGVHRHAGCVCGVFGFLGLARRGERMGVGWRGWGVDRGFGRSVAPFRPIR